VGFLGLTAAAVIIVVGLVFLRRAPTGRSGPGAAILTLGGIRLAAAAGWLILGASVDAVSRRGGGEPQSDTCAGGTQAVGPALRGRRQAERRTPWTGRPEASQA
jgi:hypothetical protein